jgi:hypothetical protein
MPVIKSRIMRWAVHVARSVEGRAVYRFLVGKPEGKIPLGKPRRRLEDNIKADLKKLDVGLRTILSWLMTWTCRGHL